MPSKDHKIACDKCSAASMQNPIGVPVYMEWLWEAPGHGGHMTQVYRCPACGGQSGVQNVSEELAAQPLGDDELLPQSWSEDALPTLEDLDVDRQEVELVATKEIGAFDFRAQLLGGERGPAGPPVGFEAYYNRALELDREAAKKGQSQEHVAAYQDYAGALSSLRTFARIAPENDHRLAAAQQMIGQLEHAGIK